MNLDEFREMYYKIKAEDVEKAIQRNAHIPEADHVHHHRWVSDRIKFRKALFRRILYGLIAAASTIGAGLYVANNVPTPHVHIEQPDNPDRGRP